MSNQSELSAQGSPKLQSLTSEALKADKAALLAKQKTNQAKARLKAAKKQAKTAKAALKAAKKLARKAIKKAKTARRILQECVEQANRQRKKTRKAPTKLKKTEERGRGPSLAPEKTIVLPPSSNNAE